MSEGKCSRRFSTLGLALLLSACSSTGPGVGTVDVQLLALNDFHGALEAPRGGLARSGRGFGDEDHAACFAVESVDERNLAAIGDLVGEEFAQAVPKRLRPARLARVD